GGAMISGHDVLIEAQDALTNSGRIAGDTNVNVAARNVVNTGAIASVGSLVSGGSAGPENSAGGQGIRGNVVVRAARDVVNLGGEIAGRGVDIRAGRDVVVGSKTRRIAQASGRAGQTNAVSNTLIDGPGAIHADEALQLVAQRDARLEGARVSAGGDAQMAAGRDAAIGATALEHTFGSRGKDVGGATGWTERREHRGTSIDAQGSVTVVAGRDAALLGSTIASEGDTTVAAARDVTVGAVKDTHRFEGKSFGGTLKHTTDAYHETVRGSEVQAGGDITFGAGQGQAVAQVLDTLGVTAYVDGETPTRHGELKVQGSYVNAGRQAGAADAQRRDGAGTVTAAAA
ncbi:hemagglutinin repeat-containing protein, partial [Pandoraea terrae]